MVKAKVKEGFRKAQVKEGPTKDRSAAGHYSDA